MAAPGREHSFEQKRPTEAEHTPTDSRGPQVSLALDASAAVALHFAEERVPFVEMEERLAEGEEAFRLQTSSRK